MDVLRHEISQLPSPDRQWTVLWLGTLPNSNKVVRPYAEDDLLRNAAELGHEALLQLLSGPLPIDGPGPARTKRSRVHRITAGFADFYSEAQPAASGRDRPRFFSSGEIRAFRLVLDRSRATRS
jgi:hypothetical protein